MRSGPFAASRRGAAGNSPLAGREPAADLGREPVDRLHVGDRFAASRGLDVVALADDGHRSGGTMPGAPGMRLWSVRALKSGHAEIVFVYRRPWEPAPIDTRRVVVDVGR